MRFSYYKSIIAFVGLSGICLSLPVQADDVATAVDKRFQTMESGAKQLAEVFYRYRINRQFDVSPNLQYVRHPGGKQSTATMTAYNLRVQLDF